MEESEKIFNHLCSYIIERSYRAGLQLEVIESAFKHKQEFPQASLLECLQVGADEWDV
jgi:hypothetical protein